MTRTIRRKALPKGAKKQSKKEEPEQSPVNPKVEFIAELNPDAMFANGFEEALIGYITIFNKVLPCYDRDLCIKILMRDGISNQEEAEIYFDFNVTGSYVGEHTPAFLTTM